MDNNLQFVVSSMAVELVSEDILSESEINKMLGVLVNDGIFAMWLYACDKMKLDVEKVKEASPDKRMEVLKQQDIIKFFEKICQLAKYIEKEDVNVYDTLKNKLDNIKNKNNESIKNEIYNELAEYFHNLSRDLDKLLFMRDLLEKILVYARYHAKAVRG